MGSTDALRQTLEHFQQQRQVKLDEVQRLNVTIKHILAELGEKPEDEPVLDSTGGSGVVNNVQEDKADGKLPDVRRDQFFGMSYGAAAKAYILKAKQAVSLDQLLEVLRNGGCKVGGANPKQTLYMSLLRNRKDFISVGDGYVGLKEFYPKVAEAKQKMKQKPKKKRRTNKVKSKQAAKAATPKIAQAAKERPTGERSVKDIVFEVLADGEPRDKATILQSVEQQAGHKVASIAVYGTLKNAKEIEKIGEEYRLKK